MESVTFNKRNRAHKLRVGRWSLRSSKFQCYEPTSARNFGWKPKRESRNVAFRALGDEEWAPFTTKYKRGLEKIEDDVKSSSSSEDIELCALEGGHGGLAVYGPKQGSAGSSSSLTRLGQDRELSADFFWKEEYEWLTVKEVLRINIHGNPRYDQCLGRAGSLLDGGGLDR